MISESLGFGKFIYFSQKLATYFSEKIVGRLQRFRTKKNGKNNMKLQQKISKLFSEQKQNRKLQQMCTKSLKNVKLQETMRSFFLGEKNKRGNGERERGGRQEQQRERREQKSKARPYTRPNSRSPASGGNYW